MQTNQAATQVISYVGEFILGGIALLCLGVALWLLKQWKQAHQDHVAALEKATTQHVEMHKAYESSTAETVATVKRLTDTENTQTLAIQANTVSLGETKAEMRSMKDQLVSSQRSVDEVRSEMRDGIRALQNDVNQILRDVLIRRRQSSDRTPSAKGDG